MKKVLRLTESDLIKFVKRIVKLSEAEKKRPAKRITPKNNPTSNDDVDSNTYETFNNFYNEIRDYLRQYIDTDCVKFDATDRYLIVDVGAPYDFVDAGFEREEAVRVKNKLRSKGFRSIGVGRFIKESCQWIEQSLELFPTNKKYIFVTNGNWSKEDFDLPMDYDVASWPMHCFLQYKDLLSQFDS